MDVTRFRLLQLPQNAFFNVLRSMHTVEVVLLSLISKKSAALVKSVNFECRHSCVQIRSSTITVKINMFGETMDYVDFEFMYLRSPQCDVNQLHSTKLCTSEYNQRHPAVNHQMPRQFESLHFWMNHLKFLFNFTKVKSIWFGDSQFDYQSIRRTFPTFDFLSIESDVSLENNRQILTTFPIVKNLTIENHAYQESKFPDHVLFGNYDQLSIGDSSDHETLLKLDDILQMNGKEISIGNITLSEKELNRLLKLWSKGAWPRLEKMELFTIMAAGTRELNKDVIFKGMRYQSFPLEHEQQHVLSTGGTELVDGGFGIFRKDGTRATVTLSQVEEDFNFSLYVWHPHCIGET